MPENILDIDRLRTLVGKKVGTSPWFTVTQDQFDSFAEVTHDISPMHVDPQWCKKYSPYQQTISFGFLTISLLTHLYQLVIPHNNERSGTGFPLNYGFDRLRLIAPIMVNTRIRAHFTLQYLRDRAPGEVILKTLSEVEIEDQAKPAMVAEWLTMWVSNTNQTRLSQ